MSCTTSAARASGRPTTPILTARKKFAEEIAVKDAMGLEEDEQRKARNYVASG
jgi:hypothetical protein